MQCFGESKLMQPSCKTAWRLLNILNKALPCDVEILLLGMLLFYHAIYLIFNLHKRNILNIFDNIDLEA